MPSTFTPSDAIDMSKERDWAANLGMLDWDDTRIVFTKRTLIEFLKYTGTTVDTNFNNISKLPRYAKFGKLSEANSSYQVDAESQSHRVRAAPGGPHTDIFAPGEEDDALSTAPPKEGNAQSVSTEYNQLGSSVTDDRGSSTTTTVDDQEHQGIDFGTSFRPTRRVREHPGGKSSLTNLWDSPDPEDKFKPTRKVTQRPGGTDHIDGLF